MQFLDPQVGPQMAEQVEDMIRGLIDSTDYKVAFNEDANMDELSNSIELYTDYYKEVRFTTLKNPLESHHFLWLIKIEALIDALWDIKKGFFGLNSRRHHENQEAENTLRSIEGRIRKISDYTDSIVLSFLMNPNLMVEKYLFSTGTENNFIFSKVTKLFINIINCTKACKVSDQVCFCASSERILKAIAINLSRLFEASNSLEKNRRWHIFGLSFSMLCIFLKFIHLSGNSEFIKYIIRNGEETQDKIVMNAILPLHLLQISSISLTNLMDYYRFMAYNMTNYAFSDKKTSTKEEALLSADIYYKAALGLPSMDRSNYTRDQRMEHLGYEGRFTSGILSYKERAELSFYYVLNYLMKLSHLKELIQQEISFRAELVFLLNNLAMIASDAFKMSEKKETVELKISDEATGKESPANSNHPGAIIYHGSYKEILIFAINFFNKFKENNLRIQFIMTKYVRESTNSFIGRVCTFLDGTTYPGKVLFVERIINIAHSLKSLGRDFLLQSGGLNNISVDVWPGKNFNSDDKEVNDLHLAAQDFNKKSDYKSLMQNLEGEISSLIETEELVDNIKNISVLLD